VLPSVPGQLYDYEPVKTDTLGRVNRAAIKVGAGLTALDADRFGDICPWWLQEITHEGEHWMIAARLNFGKEPLPEQKVRFKDLGLDGEEPFLVHEFWQRKWMGVEKEAFTAEALPPLEARVYAIRARQPHPQIVSTSRHYSQGAVEVSGLKWDNATKTLSAQSNTIETDPYVLTISVPKGWKVQKAEVAKKPVRVSEESGVCRMTFPDAPTGPKAWAVRFRNE
jgi:hypothetical protein